ncbi:hypothetical protein BSK66_12570 [Paenibacillus odorifer]|uniref:Restriction endonuclease type IV Mrr domain-containing protein n=2 Tax=Paenibacillus TaxID=44249 RepID=A0A1R0XAG2_9BACL|nr:endonuclease [Paenibacillus sp. FSL H8-237]OMD31930.1 hypothetical protein BJP51_16920 [Paenibacillus odorifer]OME58427.1 hypothetical protein BSK66_12570 [Paenibacillus odorifer]
MGYETNITHYIRDGGKDIVAKTNEIGRSEKVLIECKRYEENIGSDSLRSLFGLVHAEKASRGILVSSSDYTSDAKEFGKTNGIELINHSDLTQLMDSYLGSRWSIYIDRIINSRIKYYL